MGRLYAFVRTSRPAERGVAVPAGRRRKPRSLSPPWCEGTTGRGAFNLHRVQTSNRHSDVEGLSFLPRAAGREGRGLSSLRQHRRIPTKTLQSDTFIGHRYLRPRKRFR